MRQRRTFLRFVPRQGAWRGGRRGTVLILTLWLTVVLMLLAQSLAYEMQVEMRLTSLNRDQFRAEQLARIGIARAVTDLRNDRLIDSGDQSNSKQQFDALGDVWAAGSVTPYRLDINRLDSRETAGYADVLVVDEESKLPLNGSFDDQWRKTMQYLLMTMDVDEDDAKDLANAIADWADADDVTLDAEAQNETVYYTAMLEEKAGRSKRRRVRDEVAKVFPKNAPYTMVDELLQIPGMTAQIFYGYDPEEGEEPRFFPTRSVGQRLDSPPALRDLVTVRTRDLNLNTASEEVLTAICAGAVDDLDAGKAAASAIVEHRQGRSTTDIDNNTAFRSLEELGVVEGLSGPLNSLIRGAARDVNLTVQSNLFTIYCRAQAGQPRAEVHNSVSAKQTDEVLPTAHIVAECERQVLLLEGRDFEDMVLPGYSPQNASDVAARVGFAQWYIPVVYFRSWNSF